MGVASAYTQTDQDSRISRERKGTAKFGPISTEMLNDFQAIVNPVMDNGQDDASQQGVLVEESIQAIWLAELVNEVVEALFSCVTGETFLQARNMHFQDKCACSHLLQTLPEMREEEMVHSGRIKGSF